MRPTKVHLITPVGEKLDGNAEEQDKSGWQDNAQDADESSSDETSSETESSEVPASEAAKSAIVESDSGDSESSSDSNSRDTCLHLSGEALTVPWNTATLI